MAFTAYPAAGETLTAATLQALISELRPLFVEKTADETVNNSATLQNDDVLLLAPAINCKYELDGVIRFNSGTTPDFKCKFTVATGASLDWNMWATAGGSYLGFQQDETTTAVNDGLGVSVACIVKGILTMAGTAGNLQFQWAQNTANASNTIVQAGSFLRLKRMS